VTQLVARVDDKILDAVDELVRKGVVSTRSEAVRLGLESLVDRFRRQQTARAIVEGYARQPQTHDELAGLEEATRALIEEEPW